MPAKKALSCMEWKFPEEGETGCCGNCAHCRGVDKDLDVCRCGLDNPHKDWRFNDNEPCQDWEYSETWPRPGFGFCPW